MTLNSLAKQLVNALGSRTVATAESLTGGLVGATITSVPGASVVYRGGVVTYASDLKASMLDIPSSTMAHGVVSKEVASAMAVAVAYFLNAEFGVATTGVAGPQSQEGHPPGTVYISVFRRGQQGAPESVTEKLLVPSLSADPEQARNQIREFTVESVLKLLLRMVTNS